MLSRNIASNCIARKYALWHSNSAIWSNRRLTMHRVRKLTRPVLSCGLQQLALAASLRIRGSSAEPFRSHWGPCAFVGLIVVVIARALRLAWTMYFSHHAGGGSTKNEIHREHREGFTTVEVTRCLQSSQQDPILYFDRISADALHADQIVQIDQNQQ